MFPRASCPTFANTALDLRVRQVPDAERKPRALELGGGTHSRPTRRVVSVAGTSPGSRRALSPFRLDPLERIEHGGAFRAVVLARRDGGRAHFAPRLFEVRRGVGSDVGRAEHASGFRIRA
jgi:hypothetical protein